MKKYKAGATTVWQLGTVLYRLLHGYRFDTMSFVTDRIQLSSELSQGKTLLEMLDVNVRKKTLNIQKPALTELPPS